MAAPKAAQNGQQSIEQLQQRYQQLHTRKIQAEAHLDNARKQLTTLQDEARQKYGTADVVELRQKLVAMKAENESKRAGYQTELERIESELAVVEQKFAASESTGEKTAS